MQYIKITLICLFAIAALIGASSPLPTRRGFAIF